MGVWQYLRAGEGAGEVPTEALRDMPKCPVHKMLSGDGLSE